MRKLQLPSGLAACLAFLTLWSLPASADMEQTHLVGDARSPWTRGVPPQEQTAADALFLEGNEFWKANSYAQAAEKYREALQHWNHPGIHYNLALSLVKLDQPIEVYEHLSAAIEHGPAPLDTAKYEYARNYKALIEKQIARAEIVCDEPGAVVTMDGKRLFVGPGTKEVVVPAGQYSIVATNEGYLPDDKSPVLAPGKKTPLTLKLYPVGALQETTRRWAVWKPWAVLGMAPVVATGGVLLHLQASKSYRGFDSDIRDCIGTNPPLGCQPSSPTSRKLSRGDFLQGMAFTAYAVSGAALVGGLALIAANRPQTRTLTPEEYERRLVLTPIVGGDTKGVLATVSF